MAWAKNGSTNLSSAGDNITLSNLTASKTNMFLCHGFASGSNPVMAIQYNSDTGSNYARRGSTNGGADSTATSGTYAHLSGGGLDTGAGFVVGYILNVPSEEKLSMNFFSNGATIGAATAPDRGEYTGKWANTSDSITTINITNANTGDFGINSNLSVLGSELTPASAKTIETGSIYIDTDINGRWWYDGTNWNMQPIFEDDFSTDNWTDSDSAKMGVQSGYLYAYGQRDGTNDSSSRSLGTTLNGDFVFRTKVDITSWSAGSVGYGKGVIIGLSNQSNTASDSTAQDSIAISISARQTNGDGFYAIWSDNQGMGAGGSTRIGSLAISTGILYFEIVKDGTTVTYNIYSDNLYSTLVATASQTSVTATGFTYAVVRNENGTASTQSGYVEADIDDWKVFSGVTSVQQ